MERYSFQFLPEQSLFRLLTRKKRPSTNIWGNRLQSRAHLLCIKCQGLTARIRSAASPHLSSDTFFTVP